MPKVYNKRHKDVPPDAIYVGRPTKWGNPFSHQNGTLAKHRVADRNAAVEAFRAYAMNRYLDHHDTFAHDLVELRGRDLVCWCAPKPCHADILLEIANQ